MYKFINEFVEGVKPSEQGWMWPASDTGFLWFQETIHWYLEGYKNHGKKFDVAIQAGGHCGVYTSLISTMYKTVYTFEPSTDTFNCLVHNCPQTNVKKFNGALGNNNQMMHLSFREEHNFGGSQFSDNKSDTIVNDTLQFRIDDLGLTSCDLIHLDIEKGEENAIKGAEQTIKQYKPLIVLETVTDNIKDFLGANGYIKVFANHCSDAFYVVDFS